MKALLGAGGRRLRSTVVSSGLVCITALAIAACGDGGVEGEAEDVEVTTAEAEGEASGELTISN